MLVERWMRPSRTTLRLRRICLRSCMQWKNSGLTCYVPRSLCTRITLPSSTSSRRRMPSLASSDGFCYSRSLIWRSKTRQGPRMSWPVIFPGSLLRATTPLLMMPFPTSISWASSQGPPHGLLTMRTTELRESFPMIYPSTRKRNFSMTSRCIFGRNHSFTSCARMRLSGDAFLRGQIQGVISHCHDSPCGGHASTSKTAAKVL